MSILDTIKKLFCSKSCNTTESSNKEDSESKPQSTSSVSTEDTSKVAEAKPIIDEAKPIINKAPTAKVAATASTTNLQVPEDSTLKRHFLSTLKAGIESKMQARPTESTQRRHYDSTVQAELEKLLNS